MKNEVELKYANSKLEQLNKITISLESGITNMNNEMSEMVENELSSLKLTIDAGITDKLFK